MEMNEQRRQLGRAKNAVLSFLEQKLSIPKIYFDADWGKEHVDVLAIDRDGVGDVHAVLVYARPFYDIDKTDIVAEAEILDAFIDRFSNIPAQYKYITAVDVTLQGLSRPFGISPQISEKSFAEDGLGRIGFLTVDTSLNAEPVARVAFKPERFRALVAELADEYVQKHNADWEIRA